MLVALAKARRILRRDSHPHLFHPLVDDPYWPPHAARAPNAVVVLPLQYERADIF